jgi:hypothetical protein
VPWTQQIAGAHQLGADRVGEQDLARQDAVEHEQPEMPPIGIRQLCSVPWATPDRAHTDLQVGAGPRDSLVWEQPAQVGIEIQQRYDGQARLHPV